MKMHLDGFDDVSVILSPGVYALVKQGIVIYVGKSRSMYSRIYTHRTTANRAKKGKDIPSWLPVKGFVFDQVFVRKCRLEELDDLEAQMINRYKPRYNESLKTSLRPTAIPLTVAGVPLVLNAQANAGPRPHFERRV